MLAKADIDQIMNQLRVELVGASDAQLRAKMFDVMTEFFNDTSSWTETITIAAVPDQRSYAVTPTDGQIIRLEAVVDGQNGFIPALMAEPGVVVARWAPNVAQTWYASVVKNVSMPATRDGYPIAPEWVLKQWHLAIKHGVLGNMMNEKTKSYSDSKGAAYNLTKFRGYIGNARVSKLRANTNGSQAWRFPQGFRANSQQGGVPSFGGNERVF